MDLGLTGQRAVVTGGSSGIGLATVRRLLADGVKVAFCGRDQARLDAALESLPADLSANAFAASCDVLEEAQLAAFREQVIGRFGGLDILVNNAGQGRWNTFATATDEDWETELRLKFFGAIRPTRTFLPDLQQGRDPAIVVVNSLQARQPQPHMVTSAAARAGLQNLVKSMSNEFAPRVRVNAVLVGIIDSGQWERRWSKESGGKPKEVYLADIARARGIPLERVGVPDEPATAICYLASPAAGFITGASLDVSGGQARFA